jgi:hypothetical protein
MTLDISKRAAEPLSPDKRKKVKQEVDKNYPFGYENAMVFANDLVALTQTTARLIKTAGLTAEAAKKWYSTLLVDALATGDTNAIEKLCSDLLEPQDGK